MGYSNAQSRVSRKFGAQLHSRFSPEAGLQKNNRQENKFIQIAKPLSVSERLESTKNEYNAMDSIAISRSNRIQQRQDSNPKIEVTETQRSTKIFKNLSKSQARFKSCADRNFGEASLPSEETMDSESEKVPSVNDSRHMAFRMFKKLSKNPPPASTETVVPNDLEVDESELDDSDRKLRCLRSSATMIGEISQMFGKLLDNGNQAQMFTLLNMQNLNATKTITQIT